jgi:hypothetical protein
MMKTVNDRYKPHIKILLDKVREDGKPFPASTHELYVYLVVRVPDPRVSTPQTHVVDSAFVSVEARRRPEATVTRLMMWRVRSSQLDPAICVLARHQLQKSFTGRPTVCI